MIPTPTAPRRSLLSQWFVSADEPRLRAAWRLGLHGLLIFIFLTVLSIAILLPAMALGQDVTTIAPLSLANLLPSALALTLATWVARRFLDRRSFASLGFAIDRHTVPDLVVGFLIPGVMMASILAIESAAGWLHFEGWAWQVDTPRQVILGVVGGLVGFALVGYQEELIARGYQLQNLRDGLGTGWAVFLSSAIFAVMHLSNPNVTWYSALLGLIAAGYFLAFGWIRTRSLWLPIGLHMGWDFFEGTVFGFQVSGLGITALIRQTVSGPEAFTGGAFGPEAGLVLLPALALGAGLTWLYTRGRLSRDSSPGSASQGPA